MAINYIVCTDDCGYRIPIHVGGQAEYQVEMHQYVDVASRLFVEVAGLLGRKIDEEDQKALARICQEYQDLINGKRPPHRRHCGNITGRRLAKD